MSGTPRCPLKWRITAKESLMVKINFTWPCTWAYFTSQARYSPFRDNRGLGELISRPRVGIDAPRDNGALGEFISRPRMARDLCIASHLWETVHISSTHFKCKSEFLFPFEKLHILRARTAYLVRRSTAHSAFCDIRLQAQIISVVSCHNTMMQYKKTKEDNCTIMLQRFSTFRFIGLLRLHHNVVKDSTLRICA